MYLLDHSQATVVLAVCVCILFGLSLSCSAQRALRCVLEKRQPPIFKGWCRTSCELALPGAWSSRASGLHLRQLSE